MVSVGEIMNIEVVGAVILYASVLVLALLNKEPFKDPGAEKTSPGLRLFVAFFMVLIFGAIFWALGPALSFLSKLMLMPVTAFL